MTVRVGALLWPQTDSWPALRDAAVRADKAGLDSLWTWDHLMAIVGPVEQPILEGWTTLAALAAITTRPTLGLMVGANTFRNPGLTAKLATTLDHVSGGRAVLGIGGAWFGREHDGYGIDFGSGFGERLDRLDEAVMLLRRLLDGERIADHAGRYYTMHDALVEPRPVQPRLPILIGGSGPQKTLRTTARYADAWNAGGSVEELRTKDAILRERCAEVGRNPDEIERTTSVWMVIREDPAEARQVLAANAAANGDELADDDDGVYVGSPEKIADELRPIVELGFRHVIVDAMAPYDAETLERLPDVRERLA
ncbi:MAG TPA: TIGR03560 family F420-dependent LLM class oxidoreductase [Candidatus Limnocylindrales bacterium]|nr:TIGR03560 family F420-dependent LLM class oxidoreductase [Candidatus Limnocylindrales bacterium]